MKSFPRYKVLSITLFLVFSANAQEMQNGKWEVTTIATIPKMLTQIPAHKDIICINNKNHTEPSKKPPIAVHESCQFHDYRVINNYASNYASWKMQCEGELNMTGTGSITFHGDNYSGYALIIMKLRDSEYMEIDHTYSGKRIGDC